MLIRPKLRYHPDGHPVLSRDEIESFAGEFLKKYFVENLHIPTPLKPADLIALVHREDGVTTERGELGSEQNLKRLGRMYLKRRLIILDHVLFSERQISLPFVTAHECAHWLLHRDCPITAIKEREHLPDDDESSETMGASHLGWSALDWLEWQASKLAGALLVPQSAAENTVVAVQNQMGIMRNKGVIFENDSAEGQAESQQQLDVIAKLFGVSKTVMRIRLTDLGKYRRQKENARLSDAHPESTFPIGRLLNRHSP